MFPSKPSSSVWTADLNGTVAAAIAESALEALIAPAVAPLQIQQSEMNSSAIEAGFP